MRTAPVDEGRRGAKAAIGDGLIRQPDGARPEATVPLRVAFVCASVDPAVPQVRRRCLQPATALRRFGIAADLLDRPPSLPDLSRWNVLVFTGPLRVDHLACMKQASDLGAGVVLDLDPAAPADSREAMIRQKGLELAAVATTASPAAATRLERDAPPGLAVLVVADPVEDTDALAEPQEPSKAAVATSAHSGRRLAEAARQAWHLSRSVPLAEWPRRLPRSLAYRLGRGFGKLARREAAPEPPSDAIATVGRGPAAPARTEQAEHAERLSTKALGEVWQRVVDQAARRSLCRPSEGPERIHVVAFMDLIQDLDVLLPILDRLHADPRFALRVCITDWLDTVSPRVVRELLRRDIFPEIVTKKEILHGLKPDLDAVAALITASETSHPAHRVPFALTRRANAAGIPTYTMQHGLENIGLTYFAPDPEHPGPIRFASSTILTWGPVERLPDQVTPQTRARCFAAGTTKPADAAGTALPLDRGAGPVVAVFENLHWGRYPESYRDAFIRDLREAATARPEATFLVKPHHAGRYLGKNPGLLADAPGNVVLADPVSPIWEPHTAGSIIGAADAVITTPSTVALDAARAGRPVAVAGYGLDLPVYGPLPILESIEDWHEFIDAAAGDGANLAARMAAFRERHVVEGDAVGRIVERIAADVLRAVEA